MESQGGRRPDPRPAAIAWGTVRDACWLSCVSYLSHCQQTLLMKMGVANVYSGLCLIAAHVGLLTPKDDSHLEVVRTLATPPTPCPSAPFYTKDDPRLDTEWCLL